MEYIECDIVFISTYTDSHKTMIVNVNVHVHVKKEGYQKATIHEPQSDTKQKR